MDTDEVNIIVTGRNIINTFIYQIDKCGRFILCYFRNFDRRKIEY